jgi:hypothetical protein
MQFLCIIIALPVVLVAAGCATSSGGSNSDVPEARPRVIEQRVQRNGWSPKDARRATSLYALKCGRCHKFYDPAAYDTGDWDRWMGKMAKKAKLSAEQGRLLSTYLSAGRIPQ